MWKVIHNVNFLGSTKKRKHLPIPNVTSHLKMGVIWKSWKDPHSREVEQLNYFSPVCVLSCCFKTFDIMNDFSHFEQLNGLFPLQVLSWYNKPFDDVNVLSHAGQVNDFVPVCVLSCYFKALNVVNDLSHFSPNICP